MKISDLTVLALCDVMTKREVAKISGRPLTCIKEMLKGFTSITFKETDLDKAFIKKLGWTICSCCGVRLVPKQPINGHILTRLCRFCWQTQDVDLQDYSLPKGVLWQD